MQNAEIARPARLDRRLINAAHKVLRPPGHGLEWRADERAVVCDAVLVKLGGAALKAAEYVPHPFKGFVTLQRLVEARVRVEERTVRYAEEFPAGIERIDAGDRLLKVRLRVINDDAPVLSRERRKSLVPDLAVIIE